MAIEGVEQPAYIQIEDDLRQIGRASCRERVSACV